MLLVELPPEAVARVADVAASHGDETRLKSLGICPGRRIQIIKQGDPIIVRVLGGRVGLSARLAACVSIDVDPYPAAE
ncbi:MAG TPA: FeoA family protein [Lacipirellulaceae bacterium]|nr:FeoA family protein [Lacipirellulaceae bacterium]